MRSLGQMPPVRWVMASHARQWGVGLAVLVAVGAVTAALLSGGGARPVAHVRSDATQPSPSTSSRSSPPAAKPPLKPKPKSKPKPKPKPQAINPLTGLNPSRHKVVAVKIDDTAGARPQVGLDRADIVYIEQVEGGLTRLVAIYDAHLPTRVGPVRSTRNDDPQIVRQYGPIIYVASGGDHIEYRPMDRSNLHSVINDRGGAGFSRAGNRPVPLNLFANLNRIANKVRGPKAKSIGLHWSSKITNPNRRGLEVRTTVGGTPVVFRWSRHTHRYVRYFDGRPDRLGSGRRVSTRNVIVQFVHGHVFRRDIDPAGNPAWYQRTVGAGHVVVFRDGRRIAGRWIRPRPKDGTKLVDKHGKPIGLARGGAWFVLVNDGTALAH